MPKFFYIFLLLPFLCNAQLTDSFEKKRYSGVVANKVKNITAFAHYPNNKEKTSDTTKISLERFSEKGELIESTDFWWDGNIQSTFYYTIINNKPAWKGEQYDTEGKVVYSYLYELDSLGRNSKRLSYDNGKLKEIIKYTFNSFGGIEKEETFKPNGDLYSINQTFYNDHEQVEETTFSSCGKSKYGLRTYQVQNRNIFTYDSSGNAIKEEFYDGGDNLVHSYVCTYDSENNQTLMISYNKEDSVLSKQAFRYDNKGNKTEFIYYDSKNEITSHETTEYHENGLPKEEKLLKNGIFYEIRRFRYEYY